MYKGIKKYVVFLCVGMLLFHVTACGKNVNEDTQVGQTETQQDSQDTPEVKVPIADATDIMTKVWQSFEAEDTDGNPYNDRFAIMGGHFDTAVMDMPAKYDLTQTTDLELIYCVPQTVSPMLDDAATMVHLMVASTFTAGAYHVSDVANVRSAVDGMKQQIEGNHWLDGFPDSYLVATIDEQYVISAVGNAEVMEYFEAVLKDIYGKQFVIHVKQSVR